MAIAQKCRFRKKNGQVCGADAQSGKSVCIFHDPARANDGRRARQAGGLSRSRSAVVLPADTPDHPLGGSNEVAQLLGKSINQVRRGELDPRIANAIGYLAGILLKALEKGPIEERLAHLEAILGRNSTGSELFDFRTTKEADHEQPTAASEND